MNGENMQEWKNAAEHCRFILASQSPRRQELLARLNRNFECVPSDADESLEPGISPREAAALLAERKAMTVWRQLGGGCWVLGSDTIVVCEDAILGKPEDKADAARMLKLLSDRWHEVMTSLALVDPQGEVHSALEVTRVHFTAMTESDIQRYIDSGDPMDKAGAYGIQGGASPFIDRIEGCYYNVVGLPLARLKKLLAQTMDKEAAQ